MTYRPLIVCTLLAGCLLVAACSKDSSPPTTTNPSNCSTVSASFATNVLPLVQRSCATSTGCHATGSTNSGGPLTNYAQISGRATRIKNAVNGGTMPPGGSLSNADKAIISCWVDGGALNN